MAAYNKFNSTVKNVIDGLIDFDTHAFKAMLTNTAPVATNSVKADITEIGAGNGYTAGGVAITLATSISSGTAKVTATDNSITAAGGSIGPFRYIVLYDDTQTAPADPLVCWWDYGSSITLLDGEKIDLDFDGVNGLNQWT